MAVVRGCGTRKKGGVYATCGTGPGGRPIEDYIVDPPVVVDCKAMGIKPLGVKLIEQDGVWHIFDWVGAAHYPNVADYIVETRAHGNSRRIPSNLDFSLLTPASRQILIHPRAWIENYEELARAVRTIPGRDWCCPKALEPHADNPPATCCAGLWWHDIEGGDPWSGYSWMDTPATEVPSTQVLRVLPSTRYFGHRPPDGFIAQYKPAIFLSLPITAIEVVRDTGAKYQQTMDRVGKAHIRIEEVDE